VARIFPDPPRNSRIEITYDAEDNPRLSWPPDSAGVGRWVAAAFLGFWLCGWAGGEVFAVSVLLGMVGFPVPAPGKAVGGGNGDLALFLIGWLSVWTLGGAAALWTFYCLVRGPLPESVILGRDVLRYDPGTPLSSEAVGPRAGRVRNRLQFRGGPVWELPWSEAGPIRLDRVGARQRLTVDHGADPIEIGRSLREPEREWLAQVLRAWAGRP
jgi:hypothetical protein